MTDSSSLPVEPGPSPLDGRGRLVLLLLCAVQFMAALDFAIVNVALPTIGRELHMSTGSLSWVVTAFLLPFAGLLLLGGRACDLFGRRRMLMAGLAVFTLGSLLGGIAPSAATLLAARAIQGVGGAMLAPAALSLMTTSFPEGPERDRALAVSGAVLSGGFVCGVILGGVLTAALTWRSTLLVNVPVGALAFAAAPVLLQESRGHAAPRQLDLAGAACATVGLAAIVFGVAEASSAGWLSVRTIGGVVLGLVVLRVFLFVEGRTTEPLASLEVLRRPTVTWANLAGVVSFGMAGGTTVVLTLYLQQALHYSPIETGLSFIAFGGAAIVAGAVAPRLTAGGGAPRSLALGLTIQAVGSAGLVLIGVHSGLVVVLVATAVVGIGHVLSVVSFTVVATSGLPDEQQGLAGGLVQTAQQIGAALGVAILTALTTGATGILGGDRSPAARVTSGARLAELAAAGLLVVAAVVCVPRLLRSAGAGSDAVAADVGG